MVTIDVAGRGLNIPNVGHILNSDMPLIINSYCHKIERVGRDRKDGCTTSFITDANESIMAHLKHYLKSTGNAVFDKLC